MHEMFHHPWIDEMQKQKIMERRKGINIHIICDDEEKEDDMEYQKKTPTQYEWVFLLRLISNPVCGKCH